MAASVLEGMERPVPVRLTMTGVPPTNVVR